MKMAEFQPGLGVGAENYRLVFIFENPAAFNKFVTEGKNSFADNPPNAAVSIVGAKGEVTEAVVTLSKRPVVSGNDMVFPIKVLDGELPTAGETVIMFIDPIGRPMSPTMKPGA